MTNEEYWGNLRISLNSFCLPTDQLQCKTVTAGPEGVCQTCGYEGIIYNFILENPRTSGKLVVGSNCILNYRVEMERLGHVAKPVVFSPMCRTAANTINEKWPGTVMVDTVPELEPWVTDADMEREFRRELGLGMDEDDLEGQEEEEREMLMDMGLDPNDPDPEGLVPHGMEAFDGDDDEKDDDSGIEVDGHVYHEKGGKAHVDWIREGV
jgi:hypothetical protein